MSAPRVRSVVPGPDLSAAPPATIRFDDSAQQAIRKNFRERLSPSLGRFDVDAAWNRGADLFRRADFQLLLKFHQTTLPIEDSPDLKILEGAGLCARFHSHDGKLAASGPVGLGGFVALGGLFDFCGVDADPAGRLILDSCPCSLPKSEDITAPVLQSPLGALFPEGRAEAVPLLRFRRLLGAASGASAGPGADLLGALVEATLKITVPSDIWVDDPPGTPGGSCHPLLAGLEFFLDLPLLRKNIEEARWKTFDLSGIQEGSRVDWPRLDLSALPLPEGIRIPEGRADLRVDFRPESGETEIVLNHLEARVQIPALFGEPSVRLRGGLTLMLKRGGEANLDFRDLEIELPGLPPGPEAALGASLRLKGGVRLRYDAAASDLKIQGAKLQLEEIRLKSLADRALQFAAEGPLWAGDVSGNLEIDYDAALSPDPLRVSGELAGGVVAELDGRRFEVKNLHAVWSGPFAEGAEGLSPRAEDWEVMLGGDLAVALPGAAAGFTAEGVDLYWGKADSKLRLEGDARQFKFGPLALRPKLRLEIQRQDSDGKTAWTGTGAWELSGEAPPMRFGSELSFKTDLRDSEWVLSALRAEKSGKVLAEGGKVRGRSDAKGFRATLEIPRALDGAGLELSLRKAPDVDHFNGGFRIGPGEIALAPGWRLKGAEVSGHYQTPPWQELLAKPRVAVDLRAAARLDTGPAGVPISAGVQGSLSYSPEKNSLFLWVNPRGNSPLRLGPAEFPGLPGKVEASAEFQGTWQIVLTPHGALVGGRGVGLREGEVWLETGEGDSARRQPWFSAFSVKADQLWSVQKGVAYAGGDGIRLEADAHLGAWFPELPAEASKRHVVLIVDQAPLSSPAFWKLFAKSLGEGGKP